MPAAANRECTVAPDKTGAAAKDAAAAVTTAAANVGRPAGAGVGTRYHHCSGCSAHAGHVEVGIPWRRRMRQQAGGDCGPSEAQWRLRRVALYEARPSTRRQRQSGAPGPRPPPSTPGLHESEIGRGMHPVS